MRSKKNTIKKIFFFLIIGITSLWFTYGKTYAQTPAPTPFQGTSIAKNDALSLGAEGEFRGINGAAVLVDGKSVTTTGQYGMMRGFYSNTLNLSAGAHTFKASKSGYTDQQIQTNVVPGQPINLNFEFTSSNSLTGVVKDNQSGQALGLAVVQIQNGPSALSADPSISSRYQNQGLPLGSTGTYQIKNAPSGSVTVVAKADGYQNKTLTITINSGQTQTLNFALDRLAKQTGQINVSGKVYDDQGIAIHGSPVTFINGSDAKTAVTGADGSYSISLAPGDYDITANRDGSSAGNTHAKARVDTFNYIVDVNLKYGRTNNTPACVDRPQDSLQLCYLGAEAFLWRNTGQYKESIEGIITKIKEIRGRLNTPTLVHQVCISSEQKVDAYAGSCGPGSQVGADAMTFTAGLIKNPVERPLLSISTTHETGHLYKFAIENVGGIPYIIDNNDNNWKAIKSLPDSIRQDLSEYVLCEYYYISKDSCSRWIERNNNELFAAAFNLRYNFEGQFKNEINIIPDLNEKNAAAFAHDLQSSQWAGGLGYTSQAIKSLYSSSQILSGLWRK